MNWNPHRRASRGAGARLLAACFAASLLVASGASALTFQVEIRSSTYQVVATDTYASLLAEHQTGALLSSDSVTALQGIAAPVYAGVNQNYSLLMTTVLHIAQTGQYEFEVGTDWGRGGASVVIDSGSGAILDEFVTTDDIWWANDWNNSDVFSSIVTLTAGETYELGWVGFEGCCGGQATLRFSFDGQPFQTLDDVNAPPFFNNPEPASGLLVALGAALMPRRRRKRPLLR